jgi:hypothetical protein
MPVPLNSEELGEGFPFDNLIVCEKYGSQEPVRDYRGELRKALVQLPVSRLRSSGWLSRWRKKLFVSGENDVAQLCASFLRNEISSKQKGWLEQNPGAKLAVFIGSVPAYGPTISAFVGLSGGNPGWTMYGAYLCRISESEFTYSRESPSFK